MDRRKALAAAAVFAVSITAAGTAMAANLGLLQVGTQVDPVGQLDVASVTKAADVEHKVKAKPGTTPATATAPDTTLVEDPAPVSPTTVEGAVVAPPAERPAGESSEGTPSVGASRSESDDRHADDDPTKPVTPPTTAASQPTPTTVPTTAKPKSTTTTTKHEDDHPGERDD